MYKYILKAISAFVQVTRKLETLLSPMTPSPMSPSCLRINLYPICVGFTITFASYKVLGFFWILRCSISKILFLHGAAFKVKVFQSPFVPRKLYPKSDKSTFARSPVSRWLVISNIITFETCSIAHPLLNHLNYYFIISNTFHFQTVPISTRNIAAPFACSGGPTCEWLAAQNSVILTI